MTSAYRPTQASSMTGSSVAHGFAGGVHLQDALTGMDAKFDKPSPGASHGSLGVATHSYANGMHGTHVTHAPRR